jgi:hypothetical protein
MRTGGFSARRLGRLHPDSPLYQDFWTSAYQGIDD